jgi:hypothetical protein
VSPEELELLTAITSELAPLPPSLANSSHGSDLFEAYILTLIVQAARLEGGTVTYETVDGAAPTQFFFRTSPGHIYSRLHPYTHAVIEFGTRAPLEAHVGILVAGKSQVLHECDVAVLERAEAEECRRNRTEPKSRTLTISAEAKFYTTALGLNLARSFVGLISDLSTSFPCFVANTTSVSAMRLLAARKDRHWFDHVMVGQPSADNLRGFFATAFHHYKAK